MSDSEVIRAWKDVRYRRGLSEAVLAGMPQNPAGGVELSLGELQKAGGFGPVEITANCTGTTASTCTATFGGCCPPD